MDERRGWNTMNLYNVKNAKTPKAADYTGGKAWRVSHPDHGTVEVLAPSWQAAIKTAAEVWGREWTKIGFYAYCVVSPAGTKKE